jgi:subtilisin family serine protease
MRGSGQALMLRYYSFSKIVARSIVIAVISISSVLVDCLFAQIADQHKNEIVLYIQPSVFQASFGLSNEASIVNANSCSAILRQSFDRWGVQTIGKAFPNFTDADTSMARSDGKKIKLPQFSRIYVITLPSNTNMDSAISSFCKIPGVLFAEKNSDVKLDDDPDYGPKQWYLNNSGQSGGLVGSDIKTEKAWQIFTGSPTVKIGIIDSGVETTHEELTGKSSGDLPDQNGDAKRGHGTRNAGIAPAKANNPYGGRGIDWNAQIVSGKIIDGFGHGLGDPTIASKILEVANAVDRLSN